MPLVVYIRQEVLGFIKYELILWQKIAEYLSPDIKVTTSVFRNFLLTMGRGAGLTGTVRDTNDMVPGGMLLLIRYSI